VTLRVCARACARDRGFTLLEILVVIVIIGVMVAMVTLSFNVLGSDRETAEETRRFWAVLRQAREEAELQAIDIAVFVGATEYERLYAPRVLPEGLRFRLWMESRELVLKPGLPDRSKKDENQKWPPQVTVLSSGDVAPFELQIERDAAPALYRTTAQADGDLRVEQRKKDQSDWVLVVQTKPPPEDDKTKERMSYARP
jgi:general secretion pathway protein H